jgi:hypothetical protein
LLAELYHADRVRLVAQELALADWPSSITEALQYVASGRCSLGSWRPQHPEIDGRVGAARRQAPRGSLSSFPRSTSPV